MKKFLGLLQQEHRQYAVFNYVLAGLIGIVIFLGPIVLVQVLKEGQFKAEYLRFPITIIVAMFTVVLFIGLFISSLRNDIRRKELWLHNPQSIYALISVKALYHGICLILLNVITFCGLFFVGDIIVGTLTEYLVMAFACLYIGIIVYFFLIVVALFLFAINKQTARYIGKFSYIVMFLTIILLLELLNRFANITFLNIGHVSISSLNAYLPTFKKSDLEVSLFIDFYVVEEIVVSVVFIFIYMLLCKWIERMITR